MEMPKILGVPGLPANGMKMWKLRSLPCTMTTLIFSSRCHQEALHVR